VIAGAGRVAALGHETRDHPVKDHAVIEAAVGEVGNSLDVPRREIRAKLDDDVAAGRKSKGKTVVGHLLLRDQQLEFSCR